ncbi:HK97 family phage prohead protease [Virgibacillus natechei]|uniref:HK97 family phage prohead protease n=1 Tax=Virgibacillus natechei TaxID=1216297 RepID=A0ABS4IAM4_9BACI|nr:HK97 family phage prohead protease [Virgibacillus natechei]MBP1967982.1 HK97 family phage prohead protease [Virgibacillus natechei]UZD14732.1 HK97 family phage prohead protease [Virgibacillus natechei]
MSEKEIRMLDSQIEIRTIGEEDEKKDVIVGYALRFNTYSEDLGGFIETIEPRALDQARMDNVVALINHDSSLVLGRSTSGTLKLETDEFGLKYTIDPPNTSYARDLMESMKRGDISQSSFAFSLDYADDGDESWAHDRDRDIYIRTIKRFKSISDVSVVTVPAYSDTQVVVAQRSLNEHKSELQNEINKRKMLIELEL